MYGFAKATIFFFLVLFLIKVGDCDGRNNNAIISELRRQNKNGKDAHYTLGIHSVLILKNI